MLLLQDRARPQLTAAQRPRWWLLSRPPRCRPSEQTPTWQDSHSSTRMGPIAGIRSSRSRASMQDCGRARLELASFPSLMPSHPARSGRQETLAALRSQSGRPRLLCRRYRREQGRHSQGGHWHQLGGMARERELRGVPRQSASRVKTWSSVGPWLGPATSHR